MGIQGLLPQLKPIQNPVTLHRYEGQTLAIDGYAWLHRAACSCACELAMNKPTDKYLQFFIKRFAMLKTFNIRPFLVFDGANIPVKKDTETKRREKRVESKAIAERLWKSGEKSNAMDFFQKCVDITPEMAKCVIDYCRNNALAYIVAPYEADSQMVYLEKMGMVDGILSEDSDLLVFGCKKLITKLNDYGECIEIDSADFKKLPRKFPLGQLSQANFRTLVCLSGCDYTNGIAKVGILTAMKLVQRLNSMEKILLQIQREGKLSVPSNFLDEYELANYAFQFQRVFCPMSGKIVPLNEIPDSLLSSEKCAQKIARCIGPVIHRETKEKAITIDSDSIDHILHSKIAHGDLNPYDYRKPLVNRELKIELSSKSENNLGQPALKTKSIHSFFSVQNRQNVTIPKMGSNTKMADPSHHSVSSYNLGVLQRSTEPDKLTKTINRRKLAIPGNTKETTASRFFSSSSRTPTIEARIDKVPVLGTRTSTLEDDIATEVPSSLASTQIPSSYPEIPNGKSFDLKDSDDQQVSPLSSQEDDSEVLSEVEDNGEPRATAVHSRTTSYDERRSPQTNITTLETRNTLSSRDNGSERRIVGCSNKLSQFRYNGLGVTAREPLSSFDPNKTRPKSQLATAPKLSSEIDGKLKRKSIVMQAGVKRRSTDDDIGGPVGMNGRKKVCGVNRPIDRKQLKFNKSQSELSRGSQPVISNRPAARSVSLLSQFAYRS
ncbi:Rad2 family nuclease EXO1 KNAG_0B03150 [Huiozyma naganishii CBS 8797]|uniref:Uncharacterized protein n=1 Tax=Huiozyma naganishii (strain ATCC MYA-139 / BCRC 22969 / CBS 8797 / KCTC 17520 / NBRC 10181 / NCYC 3082 / Yp74L-3) TaxID=1071383 RepID=J7S4R9_HUIN7|nr:hypothetical protein KNAG_0B03150 [Kazachstania naganishii CBS 8797]CCK68756.1 hypothetical protein KNAG_0B03150 [Kazachstania naganishii CBS 8797]